MTQRWPQLLFALVAITFGAMLGIERGHSSLPNTVNSSAPADTDPLSQGASQIRGVKVSLIDIFGLPNGSAITCAPINVATDGRVNFPCGLAGSSGGQHVTGYLKANSSNVPTYVVPIPFADGGTGLSAATDDMIMVSTGSVWQGKTLPDCPTIGLAYTQSTNTPGCVVSATQAEMETGTSTTVPVTPGRTQYHPGVAKGWGDFGSDGTIATSYNVTSIADTATGRVTVTWETDFSDANYVALGTAQGANGSPLFVAVSNDTPPTAGVTVFNCFNDAGGSADPNEWHVVVFGDR